MSSQASSAGHVFLSHGHTDHVAAVVAHARIRRMAGASMAPPTYYCPTACVGPLKAVAAAMGEMDGGDIPLNIVGVAPGERIELDVSKDGSTQLWAEPFATDHRVDSQGYLIMQRQLKGLREEYQGLPREELMALRQAGTELRREIVTPLVAYSGDTRIEALQIDPRVLKSKLLIMELSFLGEGAARGSPEEAAGVEAARGKGHIHLAEVAARQDEFKNDGIVFVHFSAKYRADDITSELAAALSRSTLARVHVQPALEAFGVAGAKEAIVAFETACARPFDFGDDLGVMMATRTRFPRMKAPLGHALARRSKDAGHRGIGAVIYDEGDAMVRPTKLPIERSFPLTHCFADKDQLEGNGRGGYPSD